MTKVRYVMAAPNLLFWYEPWLAVVSHGVKCKMEAPTEKRSEYLLLFLAGENGLLGLGDGHSHF